jgi:hypothetical protein
MATPQDGTGSQSSPCPFINLNDARCSDHFTLGRIEQAFGVCLDRHRACATYHHMRWERDESSTPALPAAVQHVHLTLHGQQHPIGDGLQATG